jgi:hypothetical protein
MSHREEAPRQELCMKCGRLLPRMHNCFEDSEPSCNSSLQESQKLTNGEQTPLTDAAEVSFAKELYPYALMTGLARQLELSLSQCREALEKERKDAERYRWLRDEETISKGALLVLHPSHLDVPNGTIVHGKEKIDAAMDRARSTGAGSGTAIKITSEPNVKTPSALPSAPKE